jgi:hypothetical protein
MRPHLYLRAYMAGIAMPTCVLPLAVTVFLIGRSEMDSSLPVALLVFPLAVVPAMWGLWNMLHVAVRSRVRVPLGVHGALLPVILIPMVVVLLREVGLFAVPLTTVAALAPVGFIGYYLVWKYVVGFFNAELGIA